MATKLISLVIPLFNEQEVFGRLRQELQPRLEALTGKYDVEVILVDDGSTDQTWMQIQDFAGTKRVDTRGVIVAELWTSARAVLRLPVVERRRDHFSDGDLQDPPELVEEMLSEWEKGYDIVFAVRRDRSGETKFKRLTAYCFYRLLDRLADVDTPLDCGDFRLASRRALEGMLRMGDKQKYLRGMVGWVGFQSTTIEYDRPKRAAGKTKFNLLKMAKFGFDGITSFSNIPLRMAFALSLLAPLPFILYLLYSLALHFFFGKQLVEGWSSLILCIVVFGSLNLVAIGVVGEYTAKIFETVKRRPDYIIKDRVPAADRTERKETLDGIR